MEKAMSIKRSIFMSVFSILSHEMTQSVWFIITLSKQALAIHCGHFRAK